jgi:SAM-dependent methyltransferase
MSERDYILGTHDDEVERLGLQHRVWRPRMLDAWRRAGIGPGQTVIDLGAGPGWASLDLAEMVGPDGKVIAVERSRRFLDALAARAERLGLANVEAVERDLAEEGLGEGTADAAWCRWLLCFLADPAAAVAKIGAALKPGGVAVFHEYADYGAWQMMPPNATVDRFRELVIQSWRDAGGDPDVGLRLPGWLEDHGFELIELRPLIDVTHPRDFVWQWPAAFMAVNARRLHALGYATAEEADRMALALDQAGPAARMITPLVVEVIARKR